jgi:hypothetical protein
MVMRWLAILLACLAVGSCSGMDAAECRTADWRAIGFEDGVQGRSPAYFGTRRKDCAEHGVAASFDAYTVGRAEGLAQFCRPLNGYHLGTQGYEYSGICPSEQEAAFVAAHADGFGLYQRHTTLNSIRQRLDHSRRREQTVEQLLANKTVRVIGPGLAADERASLAADLKRLAEEKAELRHSIAQLEREEFAAARDYDTYRRHLEANGLR